MLRIEEYKAEHEKLWDDFVWKSSKNGTLLHTRKFYQHNVLNALYDASLLFYSGGKLIAVLPSVIDKTNERLIFNSHKYCTYGGFVIGTKTSFQLVEKCVGLLLEYAKDKNINEIILRQSLRVYHQYLSDETDYALWKNGFKIKYRECELVIDLSVDFRSLYRSSTKRNIIKASKAGVLVKESNDFGTFWNILTSNLKDKHRVMPAHTLCQIEKLHELIGSEKIKLFGSYLAEEMIGGLLVFVSNSKVVHAQYMASKSNFQRHRPVNALIDHVAEWSKNEGFRYFSLGMANEPGGKETNEGLFRFKEGFGAKGTSRDTVHYLFKTVK